VIGLREFVETVADPQTTPDRLRALVRLIPERQRAGLYAQTAMETLWNRYCIDLPGSRHEPALQRLANQKIQILELWLRQIPHPAPARKRSFRWWPLGART
jgi:hypothetical protein